MKSPETIAELALAMPGPPARRYRRDELDFLPAAIDIVERPVPVLARAVTLAIMALIASAVLWASLSQVDIVATADGKIVTDGQSKAIQPLEIGTVRQILVKDGQHVAAGEPLIELDNTSSVAELDRITHDLSQARLDQARLEALVFGGALTTEANVDRAVAETAERMLAAERQERAARLAGIDRELDQNRAEQATVRATIDKLDATIPLLARRVGARKELLDKQFGSLFSFLELQQELVAQQHDLEAQKHHLDQVAQAGAVLQRRRDETEAAYRRDTLERLLKARQQHNQLAHDAVKARQRIELQSLRSPVAGTVQQLAIHTVGGVVTPAQPLVVVVPDELHLQVEARVSNRDIGFVHEGQAAEIKLAAFDFTRYGVLHGKLIAISRDAVPPDDKDPKRELQYVAKISLDRSTMSADGRNLALAPGMMVSAEVKTGRRRLIDYLLSPVLHYRDGSLRER